MGIPDPYANRGFVLVLVTDCVSKSGLANTCSINEKYGLACIVQKFPSLFTVYEENHEVFHINEDCEWDGPVEHIESLFKEDLSSVIVGVHNKGVLFRAAWWWHLRNKLPLPSFAHKSQNIDLADSFNGPAIMTAEERYSFCLSQATEVIDGLDETVDKSHMDMAWALTQRLLEYKS